MKKFFAYFAFCVTIIVGLAVSSCSQCGNVDCGTNGQCDETDGSCICDAGYELGATSKKCDVEMRSKFVGTWRGTDCGASAQHNIVITTSSAGVTKANVSNFGNAFCGAADLVAVGTVSADGSKLENFTSDCPSATASVKATGNSITLDAAGTTMTCSYNITVGGTDYTCTLTYTKQ